MQHSEREFKQRHPVSARFRIARYMRALRSLRGWGRFVELIVPKDATGAFEIVNKSKTLGEIKFSGDIGSFIDKQMYLYGNYEGPMIEAFLGAIPSDRRGTILDVGANVGTHSLVFARHFKAVHSFEPNSAIWPSFMRNVNLNGFENISLHKVGLADRDEQLTFHLIENSNYGMGTFSKAEQYDLPLKEVGTAEVVMGSKYLKSHNIGKVDAIKIDVQGFEQEVLIGLATVLKRDKPIIWFEVSKGTLEKMDTLGDIVKFFPYPVEIKRFARHRHLASWSIDLASVNDGPVPEGDYVALPI